MEEFKITNENDEILEFPVQETFNEDLEKYDEKEGE